MEHPTGRGDVRGWVYEWETVVLGCLGVRRLLREAVWQCGSFLTMMCFFFSQDLV